MGKARMMRVQLSVDGLCIVLIAKELRFRSLPCLEGLLIEECKFQGGVWWASSVVSSDRLDENIQSKAPR